MAKINKVQLVLIVLLVVFISLIALQYYETNRSRADTIKSIQLEQLKSEFKFAEPSEITRESALDGLIQAERDLEEMTRSNLTRFYIKDLLFNAKRYYAGNNLNAFYNEIQGRADDQKKVYLLGVYDQMRSIPSEELKVQNNLEVLKLTQQIAFTKKQAYFIFDSLSLMNERIDSYTNIDTSDAKSSLEKARVSFSEERYAEAASLIVDADDKIEAQLGELARAKGLLILGRNFVKTYWQYFVIGLIVLAIIIPPLFKRARRAAARRKINKLNAETINLNSLIKKAQIDCFKTRVITLDTYKILDDKYKTRLADIKRQIPVLEAIARGEKPPKTEEKKRSSGGILQIEDEE